jgi:hypothetical protein
VPVLVARLPHAKRRTSRSVIIHTAIQDALNALGYVPTERNEYGLQNVLSLLEDQHLTLKANLREIIRVEVATRIGL